MKRLSRRNRFDRLQRDCNSLIRFSIHQKGNTVSNAILSSENFTFLIEIYPRDLLYDAVSSRRKIRDGAASFSTKP